MNKKHIPILLVVLLAFVVRVNNISNLPALNADEAAIGYNAYSLIKTGLDEHGNAWPIHFQSFNDYKPGLYFYTVLPMVAVFGLNEVAVRLPGVMFGVLNVLAVYLLATKLFEKSSKNSSLLGLLSGFLLAITPWHIHFSRGGWEVNLATLLITLGVYCFVRAKKSPDYYVYSFLVFVASLYTYHSARIIVPLIGLGLLYIYKKSIFSPKNKKLFLSSLLFAAILCIPLAIDFLGPAGSSRAQGVSILADPGHVSRINEKRGHHANLNSPVAKIIHNKPVEYLLAFTENYTDHFWGEFLFLSGDEIQRNRVPETGQLFLIQFFLVVIGLIAIIDKSKNWRPILLWLAVAPVAAALTFQSPHALRSQNMVIPLTIISAYGLYEIIFYLKNNAKSKHLLTTSYILLTVIIAWSFARYIHQYYNHMAKSYPFSSQYGLEEMVQYVNSRKAEFERVIITDRYDQPYILYLFYTKYPPENFQQNHTLTDRDEFGFSTVRNIDNIEFASISWENMRDMRNTLLVGTDLEIPNDESNVVKTINFPNSSPAFEIVEIK